MSGRRYGTRHVGSSTRTRRGGGGVIQKPIRIRAKPRRRTAPCHC